MPEPAKRTYTNAKNSADVRKGYALSGEVKDEWWDKDQMRTYGADCRADGYERAANWLRAKAEKHAEENGYHEHDTGSFVFASRAAEEWNNSVLELADEMMQSISGAR